MAALYALFLQAFLTTLQPLAPLADPTGIICAEHDTASGQPGDHSLPCHQHACCLPMAATHHPFAALHAPAPPEAWPSREAVRVAWHPSDASAPRAPPDPAVGPRGPPAA
ncbi:hypothetical protein [Methylobacterium gnaphalii]|uniref:DUF2946 domain-containing protein n=1 Tax=Methylobacterium gnaphalii TaxID=1010610 RepID=A0A512JJ82_9HYPH|nr:hypothetical protein [Methylobacterium gnaphalii]GEP09932.1 hypothetical protein MGN01_17770 [Methylobacterium gnaphalii]GLS51787.1 hypothetical protein GCM10007885_46480 [Methylobacterium gnaphalii]